MSALGTNADPSQFTPEYIANLRRFATEQGTINEPNVVALLARLARGNEQR